MEGSPGNKVNLFNELKGNGVIVGVPAAYCKRLYLYCRVHHLESKADYRRTKAPSCSESHIPAYINSPKLKDAGPVFVVSVNDVFVYVTENNLLHSRAQFSPVDQL